jgi:hypothetical protein
LRVFAIDAGHGAAEVIQLFPDVHASCLSPFLRLTLCPIY